MDETALETLTQRLYLLERTVRWYKLFGIATLALLGLLMSYNQKVWK